MLKSYNYCYKLKQKNIKNQVLEKELGDGIVSEMKKMKGK